jgi:hypothetical protein
MRECVDELMGKWGWEIENIVDRKRFEARGGVPIYYLRLTIYYLWRSEDGGPSFAYPLSLKLRRIGGFWAEKST